MKALQKVTLGLAAGFISLSLVGCLEDHGATQQSSSVLPPADFTVTGEDPSTLPTTPGDNNTMPPVIDPGQIEEGFLINGGALKTANALVTLDLITLNRNQMKITQNTDCSGGTWQPWLAQTSVQLSSLNTRATVSVQYMDYDNTITRCYRQSIIHDNMGPAISFSKYPAPVLQEGSTADLSVDISDVGGTVNSATCAMNGIQKPCFAGGNDISITALPPGDYEFLVTATDDLNNSSSASVRWRVDSYGRRMSQSITVNDYRKVDILMIIDNSGSMAYEQKSMAQRTSQLLSILRGLDYQIAVTTTDVRPHIALGDGRFLPFDGLNGETIITSAMSEAVAQQRLSATLQRKETGDSSEQGIKATYRVLERYVDGDSNARRFFRDGAQFATVIISDENESADTMKNDPHQLLEMIQRTFNGQKRFGFHSIITKPGDVQCRQTQGYSYGERYKILSDLTGGVIGSVCEMDYSTQVRGIAEGVRGLLKTLTLACAPINQIPIKVMKDGAELTSPYTVEGVNLKFTTELTPGNYTIDYGCLPQ